MLRKNVVQFVKYQKTLRENASLEQKKKTFRPKERQAYSRIRRITLKAIEDMVLLLENLPEKQLEQIFNADNMMPFFKALFKVKIENRKRLAKLWHIVLSDASDYRNLVGFLGKDKYQLLMWTKQAERLQWLFAAVMTQE